MNEDSNQNHQRSTLEQVSATQLLLERYKCYKMHELLEFLDQKLERLETMNSLNYLMIWRDEFNATINVLNEKAIAAFYEKYSSLQAAADSPSIHSQSLNQSRASKKGSGLRISEIIDLTLDSSESCIEIGVENASQKSSNSADYSISHNVAQSTTTTAPPLSNQMSNNSSANQDMGEKQVFDESGMVDPELAVQYIENLMETANSSFQAPLDTQPFNSAPQEMSPQPMAKSETVPGFTAARRRGDPHSCNVCSKTFTRGTTLREHARGHTNEKPYKCGTCSKGFSRRKDCHRHELIHLKTQRFFCYGFCPPEGFDVAPNIPLGCGRSFTRIDALRAHLMSLKGAVCLNGLFEAKKAEIFRDEELKILDAKEDTLYLAAGCSCDSQFESLNGLKTHFNVPFQSSCLRQYVVELGVPFILDHCTKE